MDPLLKQRLVGTAVLVGLAVIFVPMVLDGPVDRVTPPQSEGIPLPLPEARVSETRIPTPVPAARTETARAEPAAVPDSARWAVQLGSFSASDNAEALAERLRARGFDVFVQRVDVSSGAMYRVRIGPTADREGAVALAARVERATGERPVVVPHP
ncbi:MAG: SPOR domain-containing protein [Gammaproteobacteria bacterium]